MLHTDLVEFIFLNKRLSFFFLIKFTTGHTKILLEQKKNKKAATLEIGFVDEENILFASVETDLLFQFSVLLKTRSFS